MEVDVHDGGGGGGGDGDGDGDDDGDGDGVSPCLHCPWCIQRIGLHRDPLAPNV